MGVGPHPSGNPGPGVWPPFCEAIDSSVNGVGNISRRRAGSAALATAEAASPAQDQPQEKLREDLRPRERGARRSRREAHGPGLQAPRPLGREEPEPLRHARHRGRDADPRGRRGRRRRDRGRDDGPRVGLPRPAQGGIARRRPLRPPERRGARRLRRLRDGLRAGEGARVRVTRPRSARPAVGRRRVLHDRRGGGRPPEDAVAHAGDQDRRGRRQAPLRAPGRVRLRHRRGGAPGGDLRRRRHQRAALSVAEGDHGREEEAARHEVDRRRRHRGRARRGAGFADRGPRHQPAAREGCRRDHRGRGHERHRRADRGLARGKEAAGMSVLVYALHYEGDFNKNSLGAVSEGAKLAKELGGEAAAVVVGGDDLTDDLCATLGKYGVSKVYRGKGPEGLSQPVVDVMAKVIRDEGFKYALFGGGLLGFEIGAGLTARLGAGVTMEVTNVRAEDGRLVAERPILQDSAVVDVGYVSEPGIIIGRLNAFDIAEGGEGSAEVVDVDVQFEDHSTKAVMVERGEQRGADVNIEDAEILVAGGRGLGKAEGFELCESLAEALGGAVAATRAVVDAGWYPYAAQIGQTGKTVAPKLYLAAGISGAIQHKVGMQSSENILAINKDQNAPIFEFSDLGVVGDLHKILPKLTEAIKAKRGG